MFRSPFDDSFLCSNSISDKLVVWEKELAEDHDREYLLEGIKYGFRISDISLETKISKVCSKNHPSAINHQTLVDQELRQQLSVGNYVCSQVPPLIISPLGAIEKDGGKGIRLIHDGSRPFGEAMNDYTSSYSVHYQTLEEACVLAKPNYFLSKVDLKAAYRSVAINPIDYRLTGLVWQFSGGKSPTILFDTRLPFGSRLGPSIFHRLSQAVRRMMARRGFPDLVVYLDDFLCVADSYDSCREIQHILISLLISLGFQISWHKVLGPTTCLPFLGVLINTEVSTLSLDNDKLSKLQAKLRIYSAKKRASKRQLQSLVGLLNWSCQAVRGGRFFLRRVLDTINKLKRGSHKCRLSTDFHKDVTWWLKFLYRFNGTVYYREWDNHTVHTDACNEGAGMFLEGDWVYMNWKCDVPAVCDFHINYKEVMAVILAANRWASRWINCTVTVVTDSTVTKAIINRGTCRNTFVMENLRQLFWLSVKFNFKLVSIHIPGVLNQLPDSISRLHERGQVLRLHSLLKNWFHCKFNGFFINWSDHMSFAALQVIQPQLEHWHYRLN